MIIFTFKSAEPKSKNENEVPAKIKEVLSGTQLGEHFGASLAAGDLDGDGMDDLIVGAPFRCNDERGYNHGSAFIFYGNRVGFSKFTGFFQIMNVQILRKRC